MKNEKFCGLTWQLNTKSSPLLGTMCKHYTNSEGTSKKEGDFGISGDLPRRRKTNLGGLDRG